MYLFLILSINAYMLPGNNFLYLNKRSSFSSSKPNIPFASVICTNIRTIIQLFTHKMGYNGT